MKTIMITQNLITANSIASRVHDGIRDAFAGLKGNTARTLVRNVPDDVPANVVSRQVDLAACRMTGGKMTPMKDVYEYTELPAHDGIVFMGM